MTPAQRDVQRRLAGRAHRAANPNPKRSARKNGRDLSTDYRWAESGPDPLRQYMLNCEDPWVLVGHVKAWAMERTDRMTREEAIEAYRSILLAEKTQEAANTALDLTRGACWLERSESSERDAGHDEAKAALERKLALLRVKDSEVWS